MKQKWMFVVFFSFFLMGGVVYGAHNEPSGDVFENLGEESITELVKAAGNTDPQAIEYRIKAILRLGELKAKDAVPTIIDALGYGSETVVTIGGGKKVYSWKLRVVSAKALSQIGDERAVQPLALRAYQDEDAIVQRASVQALGLLGETARNTQVLTYLYDILEKTPDNALVSDICDALGRIGDKSSFVPLLHVTQGPYLNYVKERAQKAISQLKWKESSVFDDKKNSGKGSPQ